MKETTVRVSPEGEVLSLYYDDLPFGVKEQNKNIIRASNVHFNNEDGLWYVYDPDGKVLLSTVGFTNRGDAIQHEINILESLLVKDPEEISKLFRR